MGVLDRLILNDEQRARISAHIIGDGRTRGSSRAGSPWRDLPDAFGPWNGAHRRFSRWSA